MAFLVVFGQKVSRAFLPELYSAPPAVRVVSGSSDVCSAANLASLSPVPAREQCNLPSYFLRKFSGQINTNPTNDSSKIGKQETSARISKVLPLSAWLRAVLLPHLAWLGDRAEHRSWTPPEPELQVGPTQSDPTLYS